MVKFLRKKQHPFPSNGMLRTHAKMAVIPENVKMNVEKNVWVFERFIAAANWNEILRIYQSNIYPNYVWLILA